QVFVYRRIPAHWCGQSADLLQLKVGPPLELGHGVRGKELRRTPLVGYLPCRRLRTVLAEFEVTEMLRTAVGTADASKALRLILSPERAVSVQRNGFSEKALRNTLYRSPSTTRPAVGLNVNFPRGLTRHCSLFLR